MSGCPSKNILLPVAIMAHNEEKLITRAIESTFRQQPPPAYFIQVIVVTNGCTDNTEKVVEELSHKYPGRLQMLSISEKGKTKAINVAINFLDSINNQGIKIPYVVFLDADCTFLSEHELANLINNFVTKPDICAISCNYIPDCCFSTRTDVVAKIYRAIYFLSTSVNVNSISGMCYAIRFDILNRIKFPDFHFAEDMFVSARVNGRLYRDNKVNIVFATPFDIYKEYTRRRRQEISTLRYKGYYAYLKSTGKKVELFDTPIGESYKWSCDTIGALFKSWCGLHPLNIKFYAALSYIIRFVAKINAHRNFRKLKNDFSLDYWRVYR